MNWFSAKDEMFPINNVLHISHGLLTHEYQEGGDKNADPHDAEYGTHRVLKNNYIFLADEFPFLTTNV